MLTGQYLQTHGIRGFTYSLAPEQKTLLDVFPNRSLSEVPGDFNTTVYGNLLGRLSRGPLTDLEEPFAWFMWDAGGHAPYDGFNERLQTDESVESYLREHDGDVDRIRADYTDAVDSSVE